MSLKAGRYGVTKEQLRKIDEGGGGGTTVVANPEETATTDLTKLQVGSTVYGVPTADLSKCYQTTDDTESSIVDADYVPFLDSSAASGAGAPKKSTWSNLCSKIAAKFAEVFNTYLGITSIGSGLNVDADGVLTATGSGSGAWPTNSEMTAPTVVDSRVSNIVGGYKQVGKIVYVDVKMTINATATFDQTFPICNYWSVLQGMPRPLHEDGIPCIYRSNANDRVIFMNADVSELGTPATGSIGIAGSSGYNPAVGDKLLIRGTYEALTAI